MDEHSALYTERYQPHRIVAVVSLLALLLVVYRICIVTYRLFFHPLASFPGPTANAVSYLPFLFTDKIQGRFSKDVKHLHDRYGPIVRIAPNRLAVEPDIAWRDVYAHRNDARPEFAKDKTFFQNQGSIIAAERSDHHRQRRLLAHAFSETAMYQQEVHIKVYVDQLLSRLRDFASTATPVDMVKWFNYTTFDIVGDLTFADPFDCLTTGQYHPWVEMIFTSIRASATLQFLAHYPVLQPLIWALVGRKGQEKRKLFRDLAGEKAARRIALGPAAEQRKDIMTYVLRHNATSRGMTHSELVQNGRLLIAAGSETTASALSGLTFYLARTPRALARLTDEIRAAFACEDAIGMRSTASLAYLNACVQEGLRVYPPVAETPPRISPGDVVGGEYIPTGTLISVYQWAAYHSERNFADADTLVPERWLAQDHPFYEARFALDNKAAFRPFSAGPRNCIGKNLAYAEMRLIMSRLLWNFDLELVDGYENWDSEQRIHFIWEKGPLMVKLIPRQRS